MTWHVLTYPAWINELVHFVGGYTATRCARVLWFIARSDDRSGKQRWFGM